MQDISLSIFSLVAMLMVLLPIPIHFRARNAAILINITWLFLANLNNTVNAIHWGNNTENDMPVFCDISVKVSSAFITGISTCSLCINRRLAAIATSSSVTLSQRKTRVALAVDLGLCIGIPIIIMILSYVVQPHRYDILEGQGCTSILFQSLPSVFLVSIWPVIIGCCSAIYGCIAIKAFLARRLQFRTILRQSQSGLDTSHYLRLMAMASADIVLGLPLGIAYLVNLSLHLTPWRSWHWVHAGWSFVRLVPASDIDTYYTRIAAHSLNLLSHWLAPVLAFIFFIFFGVTEDAIREYSRWYSASIRMITRKNTQEKQPTFLPKLGTTIAQPNGLDWQESASGKDDGYDREAENVVNMPVLHTRGQERSNMSVVVQVEREVV